MSSGTAQVASTEARKQVLVRAAVEVIARSGVDDAIVRRAAEAAEVPTAEADACFPNGTSLLLAVFERVLDSHRRGIGQVEGARHDIGQVVGALLAQSTGWALAHPGEARAEVEILSWSDRLGSVAENRVHGRVVSTWRDAVRQASPSSSAEVVSWAAGLLDMLAGGILVRFLAHGDVDQARRDTSAAVAMLGPYVRLPRGIA